VKEGHVKVGIAVNEVIQLADKAHELSLDKISSLSGNQEVERVTQEIHREIIENIPEGLQFSALEDWHTNMLELIEELDNIMEEKDNDEIVVSGDEMIEVSDDNIEESND
jgi:hypothetical protein